MDRKMRVEVTLSAKEAERLHLLADELATTPSEALRQLAARGRQGWPWLLGLDLRHQLRTLLMQRLRPRSTRIGFKLPAVVMGRSAAPGPLSQWRAGFTRSRGEFSLTSSEMDQEFEGGEKG